MPLPEFGQDVGRYRVEALLGRGGMGVVFRAVDAQLGRAVALKLLAPEFSEDDAFRARFLAESRRAAAIEHPAIVTVYEAGEAADGRLFIAMRLVDGIDLGALLRRDGPLAPARAVAILTDVARALDAAHRRGLVHRDVKPSNILVARDDAAEHGFLTDFGLARDVSPSVRSTASHGMAGTLDYLAPETIRGDRVDGRADVYALGCVMFESLTGTVPFARSSEVATLYAHLEDPPPRLRDVRPGLPAGLDAVVGRALEKDPARRWPTTGDLVDAARAVVQQVEPLPRRRSRPGRSPWAPSRPRPGVVAALAVGLVAAGALAVALRDRGSNRRVIAAGPNAVAVIDPARPSLLANVALSGTPSAVAAGSGAIWATDADGRSVSRIDPRTNTTRQTIPVGTGPSAVAAGGGAVWVVNSLDGSVSRISPVTNQVVQTIPVGNGPTSACLTPGAVWVAVGDDRALVRLDARTGRRTSATPLDATPSQVACGAGSVWVSSESAGTVTEIRADTGSALRTIPVGAGASGLAAGHDAVWVANTLDGTVSKIDPRRGSVTSTIPMGPSDGPTGVAIGARGVWVTNQFGGTVVRIDPAAGVIAERLRVGNRPRGIAVHDGALWIGVGAGGTAHRGGTLRALGAFPVGRDDLDPAGSPAFFKAQLMSLMYDGLVAFRRTGQRDGLSVVPDLARALPTPTDRGRRYAFVLRSGIRYSDGLLVRAGDVRRGLERALGAQDSAAAPYYRSILGAAQCRPGRRCDLSRGIVTDDATGTVVFRLRRPDGDFLRKLALPYAVAVPAGAPASGATPATGPYTIAASTDRGVRFGRNPHFRSWSAVARPDGYPDAITVEPAGASAAARSVARGAADWTIVADLSTKDADALLRASAGQIRISVTPTTEYFFLNVHRPPFDRVAARRALNLAIDRRRAVALSGGPRFAQPTCQVLPPNFPGHRPYCPYPRADLAAARRLVAASGTKGMRVRVVLVSEQFAPIGRMVVATLRGIGYRATLRVPSRFEEFFGPVASDPGLQIGIQKWAADYPGPSSFLVPLFSCRGIRGGGAWNWSKFCDPHLERLLRDAAARQVTDPAAADALWARADRRVVDQAAAIPLVTPKSVSVLSRRVGNFQHNPQWGPLLDQMWVR